MTTPEEYAEALVAAWPPLTDEQLDRIAVLLRGSETQPAPVESLDEAS